MTDFDLVICTINSMGPTKFFQKIAMPSYPIECVKSFMTCLTLNRLFAFFRVCLFWASDYVIDLVYRLLPFLSECEVGLMLCCDIFDLMRFLRY